MEEREDLSKTALGHVAEVGALRAALSRFDPKHPLLVNSAIRQRIHAAGQRAFGAVDSEAEARKAGAGARY